MNVAIFGGSGFLGLYLVEELRRRAHTVSVYDLSPPRRQFPELRFKHIDIMDAVSVSDEISGGGFDIVINLAGFANLDQSTKYPYRTMELNVLGNINILEACVKTGIQRFVYASSAYAMSDKGSFYGISKLTSEKIVEEYSVRFDLSFTILRYGSVYSEMSYDNNYIYNLVEKAVTTGRIDHGGDGNEIREYIHASDAAKLTVDIIENDEYKNEHVIFTGTEKLRRIELFEIINEILGNKVSINLKSGEYHHHYRFTPYSYAPTISKKLIANPHIDMGQGILECIKEVYRNNPTI
ncbi:NAD-dependent epimerase/dehydratase family protein [Hufsiella ginkgonis]|uniref:NAD-dependent epimerase/dehydratase family protein n=1 Tax=Hufsiella ginkgonis TaxID=2695274 RepID=A0A7K1Y319_9SPHI|nr:NAD(P)-dependent oxidoreductase [Hufsiella ginkgonis]MXV17419.1 NAD-dependent epimerase/dehydratase family protein [Hufsiella ginkgonis]